MSVVEKSVVEYSEFSSSLLHPGFARIGRGADNVDLPSLQLQHKQQVKRDETAFRPDFNGGEVTGRQYSPVGLE